MPRAVPIDKLQKFYEESARATFAYTGEGDPALVQDGHHGRPGFTVHRYGEKGDWLQWFFEDAHIRWGGKITGSEVIYFRDIPVWVHHYLGEIQDSEYLEEIERREEVFAFLKAAEAERVLPFQPHGPRQFSDGILYYECGIHSDGDISAFSGYSYIYPIGSPGKVIFNLKFSGFLVRNEVD